MDPYTNLPQNFNVIANTAALNILWVLQPPFRAFLLTIEPVQSLARLFQILFFDFHWRYVKPIHPVGTGRLVRDQSPCVVLINADKVIVNTTRANQPSGRGQIFRAVLPSGFFLLEN
jgi:hypothetical protein